MEENLHGTDLAVIESNHDIGMLRTGAVPVQLKAAHFYRTSGISQNTACADLLPELFEDGTKHFLLAHLSRENNTPDIARQTAVCGMQMAGVENAEDYILQVAPIENLTGGAITF